VLKRMAAKLVHPAGCSMLIMEVALIAMIVLPEKSPFFLTSLGLGWGLPFATLVFMDEIGTSPILLLGSVLVAITVQITALTCACYGIRNVINWSGRASLGRA
jgi:hypothetical protein